MDDGPAITKAPGYRVNMHESQLPAVLGVSNNGEEFVPGHHGGGVSVQNITLPDGTKHTLLVIFTPAGGGALFVPVDGETARNISAGLIEATNETDAGGIRQ